MDKDDLDRILAGLKSGAMTVQIAHPSVSNAVGQLEAARAGSHERSDSIMRGERTVYVYLDGKSGDDEHNEELGATADQVLALIKAGATERK